MDYEAFRRLWVQTLRDSGLRMMGVGEGQERLDLSGLDRIYECYVEPVGGQDTDPFFATARFTWTWRVLETARNATSEEDMLTQLLGRRHAGAVQTERPWLRVDVTLSGSLTMGHTLPMPSPTAWSTWCEETVTRLETSQRLLIDEPVRAGKDGRLEILAWRGEPEVTALCAPDGKLLLSAVKLSSWQSIDLPRRRDSSDQESDRHPRPELAAFFKRVKASLHAWTETLDHLR